MAASPCGRAAFSSHLVNNLTKSQLPLKTFPDYSPKKPQPQRVIRKIHRYLYAESRKKRRGIHNKNVPEPEKTCESALFFAKSFTRLCCANWRDCLRAAKYGEKLSGWIEIADWGKFFPTSMPSTSSKQNQQKRRGCNIHALR